MKLFKFGLMLWFSIGVGCRTARWEQPGHTSGPPQRIVSLSPSVTEILYGIGAFERVVAVSNYCTYPPAVEHLPRVGNWLSTNLEQLTSLRPDLIILTDSQAQFQERQLKALGVRTLVVRSQSLKDALDSITAIAQAVGNERQGAELVLKTQAALDDIQRRTRELSHPGVLCIVDRVPGTLRELYTATQGSFVTELIAVAGGRSVAPLAGTGYGKITKEALLTLDPDLIIDMEMGSKGALVEETSVTWRELSQLRAVRERHVYSMADTSPLHASQLVADTARVFAEIIHPEVFGHDIPR